MRNGGGRIKFVADGGRSAASHGHEKANRRRIRELIEEAQGNLGVGEKLS